MARASSAAELLIAVERGDGRLHGQIEAQLRLVIRTGVLRAGTQLPSSRMLARQLGVSRGVVADAYGQLVAEGYLVTSPRVAPRVARVASTVAVTTPEPMAPPARFNLNPGVPALQAFPRSAWTSSSRRVLRETGDLELGYPPPQGNPRLREALSGYLARVRGAAAASEQLLITQGATQAIGLACATLLAHGIERLALEDPSHRDQREIVRRAGLSIVAVPVDEQGIDVAALGRSGARAVLLTPAHQFPTGVLLSPERRAELLRWLDDGGYAIEDDYDAEFRYAGSPVGAVQGLRPERILYTSSVSKTLIPGLRIGWLLLPPAFVGEATERKLYMDLGSPTLDQLALADFIERGEFDRHVRRLRATYRRRRDVVVELLGEHFPAARVRGIPAGLHLAVEIPDQSEDDLRRRAHDASVAVGGIRDHCIEVEPPATLLVGFALHSEPALQEAIRRLRWPVS